MVPLTGVWAGSGRSPFSLQVSTAPVNISSKMYWNLKPMSVIFLEENLIISNSSGISLNLHQNTYESIIILSKRQYYHYYYNILCMQLTDEMRKITKSYFVGILYWGYFWFSSFAMSWMVASCEQHMYLPSAFGFSNKNIWARQRSSKCTNCPCFMIW